MCLHSPDTWKGPSIGHRIVSSGKLTHSCRKMVSQTLGVKEIAGKFCLCYDDEETMTRHCLKSWALKSKDSVCRSRADWSSNVRKMLWLYHVSHGGKACPNVHLSRASRCRRREDQHLCSKMEVAKNLHSSSLIVMAIRWKMQHSHGHARLRRKEFFLLLSKFFFPRRVHQKPWANQPQP